MTPCTFLVHKLLVLGCLRHFYIEESNPKMFGRIRSNNASTIRLEEGGGGCFLGVMHPLENPFSTLPGRHGWRVVGDIAAGKPSLPLLPGASQSLACSDRDRFLFISLSLVCLFSSPLVMDY